MTRFELFVGVFNNNIINNIGSALLAKHTKVILDLDFLPTKVFLYTTLNILSDLIVHIELVSVLIIFVRIT